MPSMCSLGVTELIDIYSLFVFFHSKSVCARFTHAPGLSMLLLQTRRYGN